MGRRDLLKLLVMLPALLGGLLRRKSSAAPAETPSASGGGAEQGPGSRRVCVLGFDGIDPKLARRWMKEGHLPNLKKLAEEGTFRELATVNPAETPVAWASFATGSNPARTNIFDLFRRRPSNYSVVPGDIEFAREPASEESAGLVRKVMVRVGVGAGVAGAAVILVGRRIISHLREHRRGALVAGSGVVGTLLGILGGSGLIGLIGGLVAGRVLSDWAPRSTLVYRSPLKARSFWELAGQAGKRSRVLLVPTTFPPKPADGVKLLSGYPTPDMLAGGYSIYTSEENPPEANSKLHVFELDIDQPVMQTRVVGPFDRVMQGAEYVGRYQPEKRCEVPLSIQQDEQRRSVTLRCQDQEQTIGEGQWSDWFTFTFQMSPLVREVGIGRFCMLQWRPLRLYLMPLNYHPKEPPANVRLSHPEGYAGELADQVGLFKTAGWGVDTFRPLISEQVDDATFLSDARYTMDKTWQILFNELSKDDWDVFTGVVLATDRVQHMMWRHLDPEHPRHDPREAERYRDSILGIYKRMDDFVGSARNVLPPETVLFVVSDHGFNSFRKGVNLNRWLEERGYQVLRAESPAGPAQATYEFWELADWQKTRAYAPGLAGIYLNVRGREPFGSVPRGPQYQQLREEIRRKLEQLTDPETGEKVVHRVYRREELYDGPYLSELPDLVVGYRPGYRAERGTLKVGETKAVVTKNLTKWSGDHITVDPEFVPGILFSNRTVGTESPGLMDLAPTILKLLGVPTGPWMDGRVLTIEGETEAQA